MYRLTYLVLFAAAIAPAARAEKKADQPCARPAEGAVVAEPPIVASRNGILDVGLTFKSTLDSNGAPRYCYVTSTGLQSPTMLLSPGDKLSIHFRNDMTVPSAAPLMPSMDMSKDMGKPVGGVDANCNGAMTDRATNLHFHGLALPPVCHQDESTRTLVGPGETFDYSMQIPATAAPGLDWYHPHPHGFSEAQVQGGASGALIIAGLDLQLPELAALPKRTFILRDQLLPPDESKSTDPLLPSWDVSINYVPIKYPNYTPAEIQVNPGERQFWRFVNAAANTIFNLQVLYNDIPQSVEIYAIDGLKVAGAPLTETAVFLPPGARVEFALTAPVAGQTARLVTEKYDAGLTGDSAPARPLATIVPLRSKPHHELAATHEITPPSAEPAKTENLLDLKPARFRSLFFSQNGNGTEGGAGAATKFYLTVIGQPVKEFDMSAPPNIVVHQGTVEDWTIANSTPEDHIFHIHQVRFQLIAVNGVPVNDPIIRDTIRVPHQVGRTPISNIRLRLDFRDSNIVGDFVFHCHILGHEDKGMMGAIRVLPAETSAGMPPESRSSMASMTGQAAHP